MTPREVYNLTGPVRWNVIPPSGAINSQIIPENRDRSSLWIIVPNVGLLVTPDIAGLDPATGFGLLGGTLFNATMFTHGVPITERFKCTSVAAGEWMWGETVLFVPPVVLSTTADPTIIRSRGESDVMNPEPPGIDPVQWYKQRLEKRKREKLEAMLNDIPIPDCAAMLLLTPQQHAAVNKESSAVGGGGGETGGDSLATSAPDFIGD